MEGEAVEKDKNPEKPRKAEPPAREPEDQTLEPRGQPGRVGSEIVLNFLPRPACVGLFGSYAQLGCFRSVCAPVESGPRLINKREAQRSFDMVARRQEAGPFVLSTKLGLRGTPDHPQGERRCGQGLVRPADEPGAARLKEGENYVSKHSNPGSSSA